VKNYRKFFKNDETKDCRFFALTKRTFRTENSQQKKKMKSFSLIIAVVAVVAVVVLCSSSSAHAFHVVPSITVSLDDKPADRWTKAVEVCV